MKKNLLGAFLAAALLLPVPASVHALGGNDDFANATPITEVPFEHSTDTSTATPEPGEPLPSCALPSTGSVWYRYAPAADEDLVLDTYESDYDTVVAVYTGTSFVDLQEQACNDQSGGDQSKALLHVYGGTTYHVQVTGYTGSSGFLQFRASHPGTITGHAVDRYGEPVSGLCVTTLGPDIYHVFETVTTTEGEYVVPSLIPGEYRVRFTICNSYEQYFVEWYDRSPDIEGSTAIVVGDGATVTGIDVEVTPTDQYEEPPTEPPPGVDLAMTSLTVTNEPVRTDEWSTGVGYVRRVHVGVSNKELVDGGEAELWVEACAATYGGCVFIADEVVSLSAGETATFSYRWDGAGYAGDVVVRAFIRPCSDPDWSNNGREVDHYVLVGGTGFGVGTSDYVPSTQGLVLSSEGYYPYLDCSREPEPEPPTEV